MKKFGPVEGDISMPSRKNLAEGLSDGNIPSRAFRLKARVMGMTHKEYTKLLEGDRIQLAFRNKCGMYHCKP